MDGNFHRSPRGGAAVGRLDELGVIEAGAVMCLRLCCEEPASPGRVNFEAETGAFGGREALAAMRGLAEMCQDYGRRPLMRHHVQCSCLGGDEACLAQIISAAMQGDYDDAMLMASLLVRADMAGSFVALAEQAGFALTRISLTPANTLH